MRCFFWLALILALSSSACKEGKDKLTFERPLSEWKLQRLDSLMQSLVTNDHAVGIAYGIHKGDHSFVKCYGERSLETDRPVYPQTTFGLASITKPFTAIAIAQLVEQGKLGFDSRLSEFFPTFPKAEQVTLYHLLSHTSGLNEYWAGEMPSDTPEGWINGKSPHKYLERMKKPYLFTPGTKYAYSNMGYLLLGEVIEKTTRMSYRSYLKNYILDPLGMSNTDLVEGEEHFDGMAKGYHLQGANDSLGTRRFEAAQFIAGSLKSFGGLKSTVPDVLKWSAALHSGKLIGPDLLEGMTAYARVTSNNPVYDEKYVDPAFPPPAPFHYMKKDGYALGFCRTEIFGKTAIWHSGGMPGYNSLWFYFPESKITFVAFANTDNGLMPVFEPVMKILTQ